MRTCLVCKELVGERYTVQVKDTSIETHLSGHLCRFCYQKFIDSYHNKGFFKVVKMINWLKKKPHMRVM